MIEYLGEIIKGQTPLSRLKSTPACRQAGVDLKKGEVLKKIGFTLVELLTVMAILALLIAIVIGTINPIAMVNKANDSRRKNDLNKIKVAFEAYHTDKGLYPTAQEVGVWNVDANCGKPITQLKSYLKTLLCDSQNKIYEIIVIDPKTTFKILTNLQNKKDDNIPVNWYLDNAPYNYRDRKNLVNYGVSSSNILWYDLVDRTDPGCGNDCLRKVGLADAILVTNDVCVSGGNVWCFRGRPWGTTYGFPIPGVTNTTLQCYLSRCCNGLGCN